MSLAELVVTLSAARVLTEGGVEDPVAEEARSLLDGHVVLDAGLARAGRWPAVDVLESVSRVMDAVVPGE